MKDRVLEQWLIQRSLFHHLSTGQIRDLAARCRCRRYPPGAYLFYEDDPAHSLYLIVSGSIAIERIDDEGNRVHVGHRTAGEWVGETAYLDDHRHFVGACAEEACDVLLLSFEDIDTLLGRDPWLLREMARGLSRRLKETTFHLVQKESQDILQRLAALLCRMAEGVERHRDTEEIVLGGVVDARLAQRIGASRESVNRRLAQMRKQGILRREGKDLIILRPDCLAALSENSVPRRQ